MYCSPNDSNFSGNVTFFVHNSDAGASVNIEKWHGRDPLLHGQKGTTQNYPVVTLSSLLNGSIFNNKFKQSFKIFHNDWIFKIQSWTKSLTEDLSGTTMNSGLYCHVNSESEGNSHPWDKSPIFRMMYNMSVINSADIAV